MTDVAAPPTAAPATEEDVTTTLYRAAIGPVSTGYYLPIFTRFEAADHAGISWNHAASLLTLNWLIFRQLWVAAVGYAAIMLALTLLVFGIGRLVLDFSDSLMMVLGLGFGLVAFVLPGLFGNALLHSECRKRMSKALAAHANVADACAQLTLTASTRRRLVWLAAVNAAVALVALVVYLQFSVAAAPPVAAEGGHVVVGHTVDMAASAPEASAASSTSAAPASATSMPASAALAPASAVASAPANSASIPASAPALAGSAAMPAFAPEPSAKPVSAPSSAAAMASAPMTASAPQPVASAQPRLSAPSASASQTMATMGQAPASVAQRPASAARQTSTAASTVVHVAQSPKRTEATPKHVAQEHAKKEEPKPKEDHATAPSEKPYFINVGLFTNPDNAANAHAKLLEAHLPSVTKELKSSKFQLLIRVRVGPFSGLNEANAAAAKIRALQLDAVVIQP